jgi:DNA-binding beta-propeller fold protein YncE
MRKIIYLAMAVFLFSCKKETNTIAETYPYESVNEDLSTYREIGTLNLGGLGAAEITDYDPSTARLFAVNNGTSNKIDVIDFSSPSSLRIVGSISMAPYGGYVNSVAVSNGKVAAAIESINKQANGKVAVFDTKTLAEIRVIEVGALPDMITYTPDGKYILTANEGEPNDAYTVDPEGSISIIKVEDYSVKTINFASWEGAYSVLAGKGMRVFGPGKNFAKDLEPEYITVSKDSKTAWVTLQENNAVAKIDIETKSITDILPLGFKDYSLDNNLIDPSDRDSKIDFTTKYKNIFGMYMPDAISNIRLNGTNYLLTANEGDAREYTGYTEMKRASLVVMDPVAFPNREVLRTDALLGRLNVTTTLGDLDGDGDFDQLYSLGARSFSVWNAETGKQVFDSGNELDYKAKELNVYDDTRSDDKSVEPEAVTTGWVGKTPIAIIGMERADAFAIYDITDPTKPVFIKMFATGDAPEGIIFIPASKSPIGQSLIVVSSENDGNIKVYKANKL